MRIHTQTDAAAASAYFHPERPHDYYAQKDEQPGRVGGLLAGRLGLTPGAEITREQFDRMCHGLHPLDPKEPLTEGSANRPGRRVFNDFCFSMTKSCSVASLWDRQIVRDFGDSVEWVMREHVEPAIQARVRAGGADEDRATGSGCWVSFPHSTGRPIDGIPDIQRHVHVTLMNATYDPAEGKRKAAQIGDIKANAGYYEALAMNDFARRLSARGYGIRRAGRFFELEGVGQGVIDKFSNRTKLIEAVAEERGITDPERKAGLAAKTRERKAEHLTFTELKQLWVDRLTDKEYQQLDNLPGQQSALPSARDSAAYAIAHAFEREAVVPERKVLEHALRHGIGSVDLESVKREAGRQGLIVKEGRATTREMLAVEAGMIRWAAEGRGAVKMIGDTRKLGRNSQKLAASPGMTRLYREEPIRVAPVADWIADGLRATGALDARDRWFVQDRTMLDWYREDAAGPTRTVFVDIPTADLEAYRVCNVTETIAGRAPASFSKDPANEFFVPRAVADTRRAVPDAGPKLNAGQQAAVRHVLKSKDRVTLIRGAAGVGKTTALEVAAQGIRDAGLAVQAVATGSKAVEELAGVDPGAATVARFLVDTRMQDKLQGGVLILDEAGQVGTRDAARLFEILDRVNARAVLVGDVRQHGAVSAGSPFRLLQEHAGLPVAEITEVMRQRGAYKRVSEHLGRHDTEAALDLLAGMGHVHECDAAERVERIASDYLDGVRRKQSVLVVAPTNYEADEVSAAIRGRLKQDGRVRDDEREFTRLVPLHLTQAEVSEAAASHAGAEGAPARGLPGGELVFQFHRAAGKHKAGDRVAASRLGDAPGAGRSASAYRPGTLALAPGDSIRVTANGRDKSGKHKLKTGSVYQVKGFTRQGDIALDNGWVLGKDFGHWNHGYVSTSHASQGRTVDVVLVSESRASFPAAGAEQLYVSVSRGKHAAHIYTDSLPDPREAVARSRAKENAADLVELTPVKKPRPLLKRAMFVGRVRELRGKVADRVSQLTNRKDKYREQEMDRG